MSSTIRIRPKTHQALKEIVELTGESMPDALDRAIEELRRKVYLAGLSEDYAALRANSKRSRDFAREMARWDKTNRDGEDPA